MSHPTQTSQTSSQRHFHLTRSRIIERRCVGGNSPSRNEGECHNTYIYRLHYRIHPPNCVSNGHYKTTSLLSHHTQTQRIDFRLLVIISSFSHLRTPNIAFTKLNIPKQHSRTTSQNSTVKTMSKTPVVPENGVIDFAS